jgi:hypothetical protein
MKKFATMSRIRWIFRNGTSSPSPMKLPSRAVLILVGGWLAVAAAKASLPFEFGRDTLSFANDTVFAYQDGHPSMRKDSVDRYTARCFVMCRAAVQFRRFARFEPMQPPLDDATLAERIREVARRPPWEDEYDEGKRIAIPGVSSLRELSRVHTRLVQENIGLGWPTYFRPGNWRVLLPRLPGQQTRTKARLDRILAEGGFFVAYITTLPDDFKINHAVLVFARNSDQGGNLAYTVYDPTFPDAPRTLNWSEQGGAFWYPPNRTFVGGRVYVWHVYGAPLQ